MSNNITLFNNAAANVDLSYLTGIVDPLAAKLGSAVVTKRISIRGGVFRMMSGGQEVAKSPDRHLNVVIIDASPAVSRTYYKGVYQEGVTITPTCWSEDGNTPDPKADVQAKTCNECLLNIKGSGQGESKACRFSRRLAVVLASNIEGDVYGLTIAATSLFGKSDTAMAFNQYRDFLGAYKLTVSMVVTKIQFDLDSATPKLIFSAERPLTKDELDSVFTQRDTSDCKSAVAAPNYAGGFDVNGADTKPALPPAFSRPQQTVAPEAPAEPQVRQKAEPAPDLGKTDISKIIEDWA